MSELDLRAHPEDLLVVGWLQEGAEFPAFVRRQIVSSNSVQVLMGRRIRNVYFTSNAFTTRRAPEFFEQLRHLQRRYPGSRIRNVTNFEQDRTNELNAELLADGV